MRILHTMLRVRNMDASIEFYTQIMGMNQVARMDFPEGKFTLAFVGYEQAAENPIDAKTPLLELTHNWDTRDYTLGDAYGHIAIEVEDAYKTCDEIRAGGGNVVREAGPMQHGSTVIAFVEDPDGYKIELVQPG